MESLRYLVVFVRVAELQSFSEAGRQLGIVKSAVSKQVSALESMLGTQLITRSTRRLTLTEAGQRYYRYAKQIIELEESALNEIKDFQNKPAGRVRIASDLTFGRLYLAPVVQKVCETYPDIRVDLLLEDKVVNIIEENIDLSIRVGWLQDSNLIARKLFDSRFVVFGSPGYIENEGRPSSPSELAMFDWVALTLLPSPVTLNFIDEKKEQLTAVHTNPKIYTNSVDATVSLVKSGAGFSVLAEHVIKDELENGELVPVLEGYDLQKVEVYAVYPKKNAMPYRIQVFLDKLLECYRSY